MQKSEIFFIHLLIISSQNFSVRFLPLSITMYTLLFGEISPSFHNYVYSTKSQESQIKAKRLKVTKNISQNDIINFTQRSNQVLKGQGSSADSMQLANIERVHGYLVPNIVACRLLVAHVGQLHMLRYMLMQETWLPLPWSMQL